MGKHKRVLYYVLQGNYTGGARDWDDLCYYEANVGGSWKEAKNDYHTYNKEEPGFPHRIIQRYMER